MKVEPDIQPVADVRPLATKLPALSIRDRRPALKPWLAVDGPIDRKSGFEWLYRPVKEPRARSHRHVIHEPSFLRAILKQRRGLFRNPLGGHP